MNDKGEKKNPAAVMLSLGVTFGTFCTQTTPPISDVTAGVFKQCRWWRCCGQVTAQSVFLLNSHNTSCVTHLTQTGDTPLSNM